MTTQTRSETIQAMTPIDPFRSLNVHLGMLLGVEDFQTLDKYHRGKGWYHNAWLHGPGVIWGLGAALDRAEGESLTGELRVEPGAALDGRGRELALTTPSCIDIAAWYAENADDPAMVAAQAIDDNTGQVRLDAHVTIAFDACLDRQVPALTEPCDGGSATTAYSRIQERAILSLVPGPAPDGWAERDARFHRVRLLMGLASPRPDPEGAEDAILPADQEVLDARAQIAGLSLAAQPAACLEALRRFAVLDEIAMAPQQDAGSQTDWNILPVLPPGHLILAGVNGITLNPAEDAGWRLTAASVDPFVRPVHLPTATIQDLVCGSSGAPLPGAAVPPRIDPDTVAIAGDRVRMDVVDGPLLATTLVADAISISLLNTATGWSAATITEVLYDSDTGEIDIGLDAALDPGLDAVRIRLIGTGSSPILGENLVPLAGSADQPAGDLQHGADFVHQVQGAS